MSSGRHSDSEDADEPQDRPNNSGSVSDKEDDRDIDESDEDDDIARRGSSSPPGSSGAQPERSASSEPLEEQKTPCPGSGEGSASDSGRGDSLFSWLQSRTIRRGVFVDPARDNFRTMTSLYCSMNPAVESVNLSTKTHGAVFNLEYSPDG